MMRDPHYPPTDLDRSARLRGRLAWLAALALGLGLLAQGLPGQAAARPGEDRMFERMDTDHNGVISAQEWHATMQRRFERMDTNRDGILSQEEMAAARDRLRAAASGFGGGGSVGY